MFDYPAFDGTQACLAPSTAAASAFAEAVGADLAPARSLCQDCRWQAECLSYALRHDVHGVWAGTTTDERTRIRQARGLAEPPEISDELDAWVAGLSAVWKG